MFDISYTINSIIFIIRTICAWVTRLPQEGIGMTYPLATDRF